MTSFGYRLNPRYAIKEYSSCGNLYTRDCSCSKGNVKDKILVPKPPKICAWCARCGHPVNGSYCQGCALLREKLEEDLVTYLKYFQDTFESSDDSTNVVNAPREPFVVKQDHGQEARDQFSPMDFIISNLHILLCLTWESRSDDGVTTSFQLSQNSRPPCSLIKDKYMMKAQVHVSKSFVISDEQALPQRKFYCQNVKAYVEGEIVSKFSRF
nr:hypothetical protein [Tanacetum cinerariifolium]